MFRFPSFVCVVVLYFLTPEVGYALLPPDVLFNTGSQLVQFFSIAATVVGLLFSSLILTLRNFLALTKQHVAIAVAMIMCVVLIATSVVFITESRTTTARHQATLDAITKENTALSQLLSTKYSPEEIAEYVARCQSTATSSAVTTFDPCAPGGLFFSSSFTISTGDATNPLVVQIDMNRKEDIRGMFTHYYFINGLYNGVPFSEYVSFFSSSSEPVPHDVVTRYTAVQSPDFSTRHSYTLTIRIGDKPLTISIPETRGDFVTRDSIYFTRYQGTGTTTVTFDGSTYETSAMIELASSYDYSKQIFFDGYDSIDATTHQFVLWDELGNFYMFDSSEVHTPHPAYPSHTWLLYKEAATAVTKKSFTGSIRTTAAYPNASWVVSMPDFNAATLTLSQGLTYKNDEIGRWRSTVTGQISDSRGQRTVQGIVHVIE